MATILAYTSPALGHLLPPEITRKLEDPDDTVEPLEEDDGGVLEPDGDAFEPDDFDEDD